MTDGILYLLVLLLAGALLAAYRYHRYAVMAQEAWLRLRIHVEMGDAWYARWKHLPIDQIWLQFTYDISHPALANPTYGRLFDKYAREIAKEDS